MRILSTIVLSLILLSCGEEEIEVDGPDILDKPSLISVMVDLQVLEAHFHRMYIRPDKYRNALDASSEFIFDDHGTTKEQFQKSLLYYSAIPDTMYTIYESALDSVNQRIAQSGKSPM